MIEGSELGHWLAERCGRLGASRLPDVVAFLKNGKPAQARTNLLYELLAERLTGESVRHFVTPAMQWGLDNEDGAKALYEAVTGIMIGKCGFIEHATIENFGATPDGLIGHDGLLEIKCPTTQKYIAWKMERIVPEEHKPQMLGQIACTRRKWVDFMAFDPRIRDPNAQYFILRFEPTREEVDGIEEAARSFLAELDAMFDAFVTKGAQ